MLLRLTTALIGGLTACAVMAADFQPVESIRAAAIGALPAGADAEATLDPALRLPRCSQALIARVQGSSSVEVGCPDGWRLFVPVRVRRSQTVLVLSRGMAPGETITADAFIPETRDASRIVGAALADPAQAVGRVARRTLSAGAVLSATDLVAQRLIRRGDNVALVSRRGGVEVRVVGKALGDAGENERVTVENLSSRRVVQGVVGPGGDVWVSR
ncbi:flagellar basal body P-ring formation protein FlgA [Pseudoxanthomonas sp. F37]|uniref:flagellar basal body P-ring formation chaperone FlgA n=1 Tax=Pseudoxanthomonas sp. F37 TaxID=2932492 RepID=UPI001FD3B9FF|nr:MULTISPECIES: flagellar basal body P-ring formation chaperone FlgA [Pseudoxanthomonas]UOV05238.1 flagellar basal body P-ring formation protein FlgA [Pseudoxanthomonas mexicana]UOV10238.1 flagellar basal body P-ring formation protein FlgA [Pseudoxanthomonas sp. F37]